jgi:hypothetical protein
LPVWLGGDGITEDSPMCLRGWLGISHEQIPHMTVATKVAIVTKVTVVIKVTCGFPTQSITYARKNSRKVPVIFVRF